MKCTDLSGHKFGRLLVIRYSGAASNGNALFECKCDCGQTTIVRGVCLKKGDTKSCGCLRAEVSRTLRTQLKHGLSGSRTYKSWAAMWQRCTNPKTDQFPSYGGRGIKVCDRWVDFELFLEDMGQRPHGTTIERKNVNLGYYKENCEWASSKRQARNRRDTKFLTLDGVTLSVSDWSEKLGVGHSTLWKRIHFGWPDSRVLTEPIHKNKRRASCKVQE